MKNKYVKRAHISERKFREVLKYFTEDLTVSKIARLACLNRNTMINIVQKIRIRIYELYLKENPLLKGINRSRRKLFFSEKTKSN